MCMTRLGAPTPPTPPASPNHRPCSSAHTGLYLCPDLVPSSSEPFPRTSEVSTPQSATQVAPSGSPSSRKASKSSVSSHKCARVAVNPEPAPTEETIDYKSNGATKPPYSYATLICMAMKANKNKMTLNSIYKWIRENFLYYEKADPSWQVSLPSLLPHTTNTRKMFAVSCQSVVRCEAGSENANHEFSIEKPFAFPSERRERGSITGRIDRSLAEQQENNISIACTIRSLFTLSPDTRNKTNVTHSRPLLSASTELDPAQPVVEQVLRQNSPNERRAGKRGLLASGSQLCGDSGRWSLQKATTISSVSSRWSSQTTQRARGTNED